MNKKIKCFYTFFSKLLIATSISFAMVDLINLLDISLTYTPYLVVFPLIVYLIFYIINNFGKVNFELESLFLSDFLTGLLISSLEYLFLIMIKVYTVNINLIIFVWIITILNSIICYRFYCVSLTNKKLSVNDVSELIEENKQSSYFSLYYINIDKVYEIAMLLNNKVILGGSNESSSEIVKSKHDGMEINANLKYLEAITTGMKYTHNTEIQSGLKRKVLENFDVKTTKSNMLSSIIDKAKMFNNKENLEIGDLVLIKNARLELLNESETYEITKLLLNGAFNDTKISGGNQDMKIEMNLSALINSLLKDCAYELGCTIGNDKFLLNIPMTFENDFENSYSIYDLQVGNVSVVGIYRGDKKLRHRISAIDMISDKKDTGRTYEQDIFSLKSSAQEKQEVLERGTSPILNNFQNVIDVIAVIQEINLN